MGQFRVTVVAAGNHGCQRDEHKANPQMEIVGCGQPNCTDCITREYIGKLKASGASVQEATIHHWPGLKGSVVDDLVNKVRIGSF